MSRVVLYFSIVMALTFSGCASQQRPHGDEIGLKGPGGTDARAQVEGTVSSLGESAIMVEGLVGKTDVAIEASTEIVAVESASLADITVGSWLEARGVQSGDAGTVKATSIRLRSGPATDDQAGVQSLPPQNKRWTGMRRRPSSRITNRPVAFSGRVESVQDDTIKLATRGFDPMSDYSLKVGAATMILKLSRASMAAITLGSQVTVFGTLGSGDKVLARSIEVALD